MEQLLNSFFAKQKEAKHKTPYLKLSEAACWLGQETLHRHSSERDFSLYFVFQENTSSSKTAFFFSGAGLRRQAANQLDYPLFFQKARRTKGYFFLGKEKELEEANALLGGTAFKEIKGFGPPANGKQENPFCFLIAKKKPAELRLEERTKKLLLLGSQLMQLSLAAIEAAEQRTLLEKALKENRWFVKGRWEAMLRFIAEEAKASRLSLLLRRPPAEGGGLELIKALGFPAAALRAINTSQGMVVEESAFLKAAEQLGEPLQVTDLENQAEQKRWGRNKRLRYKKSSCLIAPLLPAAEGRKEQKTVSKGGRPAALGFLCCSEKQGEPFFSKKEMEEVRVFSALLTAALQRQ